MTDPKKTNMRLWDQVKYTDPKHTKDFQVPGGFKGTAIQPMYRFRRATEVFGPCGLGWGYQVQSIQCDAGFVFVHVRLWYTFDGDRGEVDAVASAVHMMKRKDGSIPDEDAPKKALTDAIGYALTKIGFNADIHMGMYEKPEYMKWLRENMQADGTIRALEDTAASTGAPTGTPAAAPAGDPADDEPVVIEGDGAEGIPEGHTRLSDRARINTYKIKLKRVNAQRVVELDAREYTDEATEAQTYANAYSKALSDRLKDADEKSHRGIIAQYADGDGNVPNIDGLIMAMEAGCKAAGVA